MTFFGEKLLSLPGIISLWACFVEKIFVDQWDEMMSIFFIFPLQAIVPQNIVGIFDWIFFGIFFLEFAIKCFADFRFYMSNTYDRADFLILILTILDLIIREK